MEDADYIKEMLHWLKMGRDEKRIKQRILESEIELTINLIDNIEQHLNKKQEE